MTDFVDNERAYAMALASTTGDEPWEYVAREAAAAINRCCDEITRLREALGKIGENDSDGLQMFTPQAMQSIARAALNGTQP